MKTQRLGIVSVNMDLLGEWMHLPIGTRITDVRRRDDARFGEFEVLIEGDAVPETPAGTDTPHMICSVTITEPKVEFSITSPVRAADPNWRFSGRAASPSDEAAA